MKIAQIEYSEGETLPAIVLIDDEEVDPETYLSQNVLEDEDCETDLEFWEETIQFLTEQGVTHVIDPEFGDLDRKDLYALIPFQEWADGCEDRGQG